MRRVVVILNSASGWSEDKDAAKVIAAALDRHGVEHEIRRVQAGDDLRAIAAQAIREGAGTMLAGGGDGTLRAVAAAVAGTEASVGVLPAGTLNHFARDMEIPLDLEQAATVAATGNTVAVDIAEVNGHFFLNNSILGLYPFYRAERELQEASGRRTPGSLFTAIVRTLWRFPRLDLRLRMSDGELKRTTPYVLIANNEHAMEGFEPWKRDSLTEGRLWIYILRDRGRAGLLRLIAKIAVGGSLAPEEFERLRVREVVVDSTRRVLRVAVDGEIVHVSAPLTYRSRPGALKVIVPKGGKREQEAADVPAPALQ